MRDLAIDITLPKRILKNIREIMEASRKIQYIEKDERAAS